MDFAVCSAKDADRCFSGLSVATRANGLFTGLYLAAARVGADFGAVEGCQCFEGTRNSSPDCPVQQLIGDVPVLHVPLLSGTAIVVGPGPEDYRLTTESASP